MARNPNRGSDNYIFSSEENLERQARIMEEMADRVARHMERSFESVSRRLSESQERELNKWDKTVQAALKQQEEARKGNGMSFKQNMAANILNQTGSGQKFDANWKSVGVTIGKTILEGLSNIFSIYVTKPIQQGFRDMSSAYESNFSEIAGRMGTNRDQTYNIMKDTVNSLTGSLKNAIDANNELIPELRKVSGQGFTGDKAISQALANAVDAKLMPWLDTANDTWANLSFNLSKTQMQQIKGQQLLLQETQSGNRLLQSGIINQLTNDIAPVLTNIDLNTGGAQNLAPEAQAHMVSLMDQGYSAQEAYAAVQENLKVWKDPTAGFDKGDYSSVMKAQAAYLGGDYSDIAVADAYGHNLAAGAGNNAGFIQHGLGLNLATGIYRAEGSSQYLKGLYGTDWDSFKNENANEVYQSLVDKINEKVTATQSYDNYLKNTTTQAAYGLNSWAHGPEVITEIGTTLKKILAAIVGGAIGNGVLKWATGGQAGEGLIGNLFKSSSGGSSVGKVAKVGTSVLNKGIVATALPLAVGTAVGAYGIKEGISDIKDDHKVRGGFSIAGGATAAAGGLIAAGAANAWNPVGWGLLLGGAVTVAATQLNRWSENLNQADEQAKKRYESLAEQTNIEIKDRQKTMQQLAAIASDSSSSEEELNMIRSELVKNGLLSEIDAMKLSQKQLSELTKSYMIASNQFKNKDEAWDTFSKNHISDSADTMQASLSDAIYATGTGGKSLIDKAISEAREGIDESLWSTYDATDISNTDYGNKLKLYTESLVQSLEAVDAKQGKKARKYLDNNTFTYSDMTEVAKIVNKNKNIDLETAQSTALHYANLDNEVEFHSTQSLSNNLDTAKSIAHQIEFLKASYDADPSDDVANKLISQYKSLSDLHLDSTAKEKLNSTYPLVPQTRSLLEAVKDESGNSKYTVPSYAVGTPYLYQDTVAQLHKGEAVLTKSENKARLAGLLGLNTEKSETSNLTATEIVNAITSQTSELKQAINEIINAITSSSKQASFSPRTNNAIEMMMPTIANTRNLGVR